MKVFKIDESQKEIFVKGAEVGMVYAIAVMTQGDPPTAEQLLQVKELPEGADLELWRVYNEAVSQYEAD